MASIAKTIADAITKVSTDEIYANMEFATREEARDNFTAALLFELGLGPKPAAAHAPVTETKAPKKRASKKSKEAVVAEAAVAVLEQVKEAPKEVEALTAQMKTLTVEEPKPKKARKAKTESAPASSESEAEVPKEKKKPGPKPKAAVEPHHGMGAGVPAPEPVAEKKKPGPKPKAKPEGPVNVEKLTPTHKKHLKAIAEELKVDSRDKEFLTYANGMPAEEWKAKALDDHIRAFLTPAEPELAAPPTSFLKVKFNGKDYLVDPATKYIYAATESDTVRARDRVGFVGQLEFADMDLENAEHEEDEEDE